MKLTLRNILIGVLLLICIETFHFYQSQKDLLYDVNLLFVDIHNDLLGWNLLSDEDVKLKEHFSRSIIDKLLRLTVYRPDFSKLDGDSVACACLLTKPEYSEIFANYHSKIVADSMLLYLSARKPCESEKIVPLKKRAVPFVFPKKD